MQNDLISRSALIEIGTARKIIEVVGNWNELSGIAKAACTRLGIAHRKLIMEAPAVDAVVVVRCNDCRYWHRETGWCNHHSHFLTPEGAACHPWESADWKMFDENDFCSYGERRGDDGKL